MLSTAVSAYYTVELGEFHDDVTSIKRSEFDDHDHNMPYSLCGGEESIIPIWIKNKKDAKKFEFKLSGINFGALSGSNFVLKKGQEGVVFIVLKPQLGLEKDVIFSLKIYTNDQLTLQLPIKLEINDCFGVDVDILESNGVVCGCELEEFDFKVENKGLTDEMFLVSLDAPDFVSLRNGNESTIYEESLFILSKDDALLGIKADAACDKSGSYVVRAIAQLERGEDIYDYDDIKIDVYPQEDCYKPKISVRDVILGYDKTTRKVIVENMGVKEADYVVSIVAPDWVSVDRNNIELGPSETGSISLIFDPPEWIEEKDFEAEIFFKKDDLEYSARFNVELRKGNDFLIGLSNFFNYYRFYIYFGLIVLFIAISVLFIRSKLYGDLERVKVSYGTFNKKILLIILALVILAVLIWLIIIFSEQIMPFFNFYKYYILIGLIILIGIIVAIVMTSRKDVPPKPPRKVVKVVPKKEVKKTLSKKKVISVDGNKLMSFVYGITVVVVLLALLGYLIYKYMDNLKSFFISYLPYLLIGFGLLVVIVAAILLSRKDKGLTKKVVGIIMALVVIAAIVYAFIYFGLYSIIRDFVIIYLYYIITGIVLLVLILVFLKYASKIVK